jgi:Zn-dependent M28 family amino/carboxypeptidase
MHRQKTLIATVILTASLNAADFSGTSALSFTRQIVAFGPRPPGSAAIVKTRQYIMGELRKFRVTVSEDQFTAATPLGPIAMSNLIARIPGTSGRAIVISGHYDTKRMPGVVFVGANDGGSSAGFLLEMARSLAGTRRRDDVWLVWFDGEEAIGEWSDTDGLHGSRHLAKRWGDDGTLTKIKALINVDMIGDKDLGILPEYQSDAKLRSLVWDTARERGYDRYFLDQLSSVEDDHVPFLKRGVRALDLIDFNYGPGNAYWHTPQDTIDKLSAHSFEVVGNVLSEVIKKLEAQ